ncbi:MAG: hypothetical protein ABIH10_00950 [Spirochaetota bacterium]
MKEKAKIIFYFVISAIAIIFAIGFLLSQYIGYKQYRLLQEKVIQDCIEKNTMNTSGFVAANAAQKCRDKFSE